MTDSNSEVWSTLGAGGIGALIGVIGTVLTAIINRQPPMAAMIDARIRTLIEGYERRINDLQHEVAKLEAKIDALTRSQGHPTKDCVTCIEDTRLEKKDEAVNEIGLEPNSGGRD
jgi:hypothetical protein